MRVKERARVKERRLVESKKTLMVEVQAIRKSAQETAKTATKKHGEGSIEGESGEAVGEGGDANGKITAPQQRC